MRHVSGRQRVIGGDVDPRAVGAVQGVYKVDARRRTRRELVFEERMGAEERKKAVKKAVKTGSRFIDKRSSYARPLDVHIPG